MSLVDSLAVPTALNIPKEPHLVPSVASIDNAITQLQSEAISASRNASNVVTTVQSAVGTDSPTPTADSSNPASSAAEYATASASTSTQNTPRQHRSMQAHVSISSIRPVGNGLNPITHAASTLLNLVVPLTEMTADCDLNELHKDLIYLLRNFDQDLQLQEIKPETITIARYLLCSLLDEVIAKTEAGGNGAWGRHSLLVTLFNETWGGEKFFAYLYELSQNPAMHLDLLEFAYVCLMLGFEGRYRAMDGGGNRLARVRERLKALIYEQQGRVPNQELSTQWRGYSVEARPGFWSDRYFLMSLAVILTLILLLQFYYWLRLSFEISDVTTLLSQVRKQAIVTAPIKTPQKLPEKSPTPQRTSVQQWPQIFAEEIKNGMIRIESDPQANKMILSSTQLFSANSAVVAESYLPLLSRIAAQTRSWSGNIAIIGHADNTGPRRNRAAYNLQLSLERAQAIHRILSAGDPNPASRYTVRGVGDTQPVALNNSPQNRARNRRVEILLMH